MTPDPVEPSALAWVEAGVTGLARARGWDAVRLVALPELADLPLEEVRFSVLGDGSPLAAAASVGPAELVPLAAALAEAVRPPYEAVAVRQTRLEWSVAARELRVDELELPGLGADELVVALAPDGVRSVLVDGRDAEPAGAELAAAVSRLTALGERRFETFVVRATRTVGSRFALSVDPL